MKNRSNKLTRIFIFLYLVTLSLSLFAQEQLTFEHDGITRNYILYIPEGIEENAPLVFVMHGYTSGAAIIMSYSGMNAQADDHKFAVCYPQGTNDFLTIPHWNANLSVSSTDDIGFLTELAGHLQTTYDLNPEHTFACGMSNGGFMSYTLACEKPDVFKAIASVTGTMSGYDWNNCNPSEVVPVFQIHGFDDNVVPYDGNWNPPGGWGGSDGVEAVRDFWIDKNETHDRSIIELHPNLMAEYYRGGINNHEVWFYPIENWAHEWPTEGNIDRSGILASEEIWRFFELVINNQSTNTENLETSISNIYPNPFINFINVDAQLIEVYDLNGSLVHKNESLEKNRMIDLSHLTKGMYIVKSGKNHQKLTKL